MQFLLLGIGTFLLSIALLRWLMRAEPGQIRKGLVFIGIGLFGLGMLYLALTGKLAALFAATFAFVPLLLRVWRVHGWVRIVMRLFGMARHAGGFGKQGAGGQNSEVETAFLRMSLDHASGIMQGRVIAGSFAGAGLKDLDFARLMALYGDICADEESRQVLEAYLDRRPDCAAWREHTTGPQSDDPSGTAAAAASGPMREEEAWRVLGVQPGASAAEIKTAYQRLMQKVHPDLGGSDYLATKLNQARDLLLKLRS